jgi:hypothetical protein
VLVILYLIEVPAVLDYCSCVLLLLVFFAAALGYGFASDLILRDDRESELGLVAAKGIGILALIGACLNAVGLAYGASVDAVFGAGALLCLPHRGVIARGVLTGLREPVAWLGAGVAVLLAATILPGAVLNPHDDMTQYMLRPMLMMHSGSLGTNWFDNTGLDSLGAQSWMQALFLRHLPLNYADAFDNVICLPLCCLLVGVIGRRVGANRVLCLVAALVLVAINPVQVNTSSKYAIVLMVLGMVVALIRLLDRLAAGRTLLQCVGQVVMVAVFAIDAFAFKSTAFLFVVAFCLVAAVVLWLLLGRTLPVVRLVGLMAAVFLALVPIYLAPFRDQYLAVFSSPQSVATVTGREQGLFLWNFLRAIFDTAPGQYEQRAINSTAGFGVIGIAAASALLRLRRRVGDRADFVPETVLGVAGMAAVLSYILSGISTPWGFLRYSTPILTAMLPVALLVGPWRLSARGAVTMAVGTVFLALNAPAFGQRATLAWTHRSTFQFGSIPSMAAETTAALSSERRQQILAVQAAVPAGKSILAVTLTPTDFDLGRNQIVGMYVAGLANPWLPDLTEDTPSQLSAYLKGLGFDYLIWQRSGDYLLKLDRVKADMDRVKADMEGAGHIAIYVKSIGGFLAFYNAADELALGPVVQSSPGYVVFQLDPDFHQTRFATSYDLGTEIDFTSSGINPYRGAGWSWTEAAGTWSDGKRAILHFRLSNDEPQDVVLTARMLPYTPQGFPPPSVTLQAGGVEVARWTGIAENPASRCARIPAALITDGRLELTLDIDAAPSPAILHSSTDTRSLGLLFQSMVVEAAGPGACNTHPP